jgi:Tol biopolymer transport system component
MSRDGGNARPLITNHSNDAIIGWSRRGTLFFKSNRGGQTGLWKTEIRENKITQASKKAMPEFEGFSNAIGVTDYNSIAFSIANNNIDIYPGTFDAATKKAIWDTEPIAQHTTGSNSYPHWSPDGKSFLYLSSPSVGSRKVIVHDSSGNEKEIIPALAWFNRPQYHPSGQIIVTGGEVSGSEGIYAFDIFSNKPSQLIDTKLNETRFHGQWSKDGITYYNRYSDAFKGEYKLNKTIGEKTTLYSPPAGWLTQGGLLSPDERTLGLGIAHPEKGQKIILVDTKTGASKDLISKETYQSLISFPCCRPWTWTPDSKHILIAVNEENENSKLIQVSTEDGSITPLLSGKGITNPHLNADGKRLLVQMGTIENEIWLLLEKKVDKSKKTDLH